ncbi:UDP-glucose dehydrogenase family protein [Mangrovibacillus cuniculi]|uniref:UDP-glucose 6-dehydrogenase n=1 Tax=Mangrovibacillus cuniculi TaxID=2593652 RepID=A0A7S8CD12_9BACI|nr:UDP-glucose/GDP-mannose dehydrogenase family protein [Mangrovibacillus cuniculi]QPC47667.1 UDP-glucose/GDP-mannose dehydrogenase family protein [Mangrovibacillus cuniculi]
MKNIAIIGTGYVGLVTGVCLSEIGHHVTCVDIDQAKIETLQQGISPIYEPGLEELTKDNVQRGRLHFTTSYHQAFAEAEVIFIAVGTPQNPDGSANLTYVQQVSEQIGRHLTRRDTVIVTKSTVPVGTNRKVRDWIISQAPVDTRIHTVSNPEFLREGSAVQDTFQGDRIVIGTDSPFASILMEEVYSPFGLPIFSTDIESAELIKYASNAFLATKISFINEIANLCEKLGANVEDVAAGMGMDTRIGSQFLRAGIGYGGSCFPKDTKALVQLAGDVQHNFDLLESVIRVNHEQQRKLFTKAMEVLGSLQGKRIAMLGLAFKPNTDDMREAASLILIEELQKAGADIIAYDPIAMKKAQAILGDTIEYSQSVTECIQNADAAMIVTEWEDIKNTPLSTYVEQMKTPVILDGRNCYTIEEAAGYPVSYYSIGRPSSTT